MTTTKSERYVVVASLRDGSAAYVNGSRVAASSGFLTVSRRWAWKMTQAAAEEKASRLNGVLADGHCHRRVGFFYPAKFSGR